MKSKRERLKDLLEENFNVKDDDLIDSIINIFEKRDTLGSEEIQMVEYYRLLFPPGMSSKKKEYRSSVSRIVKEFEKFFIKYPAYRNWDLILQATARYIDKNEPTNYEEMYDCINFIILEDGLATYCKATNESVEIYNVIKLPV